MSEKSIILLSGGLDSLVSLSETINKYNVELALIFNYGQKAFGQEFAAAQAAALHYEINLKMIDLGWYKKFMNGQIPEVKMSDLENNKKTQESAAAVWLPNRNSLFVNIAACYADFAGYSRIIIGANKEEAAVFVDNSKSFIDAVNESLKYSTRCKVKVEAPLIEMDKIQIIQQGLKNNAPLELLYSCYKGDEKHCGVCESCLRLKRALLQSDNDTKFLGNLINNLF